MFGQMHGISAQEFGARVNALGRGGRGGRSVPRGAGHRDSNRDLQTTTPLCLYCAPKKAPAKR